MSDEIEKRAQFELGIVPYHTNELTKYSGDEWGEIAAFKKGHKAGTASCAAGPWVSVKERLPKMGMHVVAFYRTKTHAMSWIAGVVDGSDDGLFIDYDIDGMDLVECDYWAEIREPEEKGEG